VVIQPFGELTALSEAERLDGHDSKHRVSTFPAFSLVVRHSADLFDVLSMTAPCRFLTALLAVASLPMLVASEKSDAVSAGRARANFAWTSLVTRSAWSPRQKRKSSASAPSVTTTIS
jgi:hypothetical protein